jgi:hypothetical protein
MVWCASCRGHHQTTPPETSSHITVAQEPPLITDIRTIVVSNANVTLERTEIIRKHSQMQGRELIGIWRIKSKSRQNVQLKKFILRVKALDINGEPIKLTHTQVQVAKQEEPLSASGNDCIIPKQNKRISCEIDVRFFEKIIAPGETFSFAIFINVSGFETPGEELTIGFNRMEYKTVPYPEYALGPKIAQY